MLHQVASLHVDDEIAAAVQAQALGAGKAQMNLAGVSPGSDVEIVLQLILVAVISQANARIDAVKAHAPIIGNAGTPLAWIVATFALTLARAVWAISGQKCSIA